MGNLCERGALMKRSLTAALLLALAVVLGPVAGDALGACAPRKATAYDNPADRTADTAVRNNQWLAQSFTVPTFTALTTVSLYANNFNQLNDSITVEIRDDDGGLPGDLLGTRTRTLANTADEFADFDFSSDQIPLAAGQTYYIVAVSSDVNGYGWAYDVTDPTYSQGTAFSRAGTGGTWSEAGFDLLFRVNGPVTCTADIPPPGPQPTAPVVAAASALTFSNRTFAAESSGPSATRKKAPRGTKVSFQLSAAANVRFTVTQRGKGRKVKKGKKIVCSKPTRKNRKRKACKRTVTLKGSFSRNGAAGANSFHFSGRLRGRKLKPGRYRLVATPSAGGVNGKPTSSAFRIVR
jgi:hypothetical protein